MPGRGQGTRGSLALGWFHKDKAGKAALGQGAQQTRRQWLLFRGGRGAVLTCTGCNTTPAGRLDGVRVFLTATVWGWGWLHVLDFSHCSFLLELGPFSFLVLC